MKRPLAIRPEAEAELQNAFDWYEDRASGLGVEFLRCVDAVFSTISRTPKRYPCVHRDIRRALTRRFPFSVLFIESGNGIMVLAVFHAKCDPERWRSRVV